MKARIFSVLALSVVFLWGCGGGSGLGTNNAPPDITTFTAATLPNTAPCDITFTVVASDPDGTVTKYEWDYEYTGAFTTDLDSGLVATATHNYGFGGQHICAVRVTDDKDKFTVRTLAFTLGGNQPPTVTLSCNPTSGAPTLTVTATATAVDPDGTIAQYEWDWDYDGVTFNGTVAANPATHDYTVDGTYQVMVRVTDNGGATATSNVVTITVANAPANNPPVINSWSGTYTDSATPTPTSGTITGADITITNPVFPVTINASISASDLDSDPLTYEWEVDTNWGWTGTTILSTTNSVSYSKLTTPGTYYATVRVSDGKADPVVGQIKICLGAFIEAEFYITEEAAGTSTTNLYAVPEARVSGGKNHKYVYKCLVTDTIYFHNDTVLASDFIWDFGDGTTVADQSHQSHQYAAPGIYHVTMSINNAIPSFQDIAHGIVAVGDSTHTVATHLVTWDDVGDGGGEPDPNPTDGDYSANLTTDASPYAYAFDQPTKNANIQLGNETGDWNHGFYYACYHVDIAAMAIPGTVTVDAAVIAPYVAKCQVYGGIDIVNAYKPIGAWGVGDPITWADFGGGAPPLAPDAANLISTTTLGSSRYFWGDGSQSANNEFPPYLPLPVDITSAAQGWISGAAQNYGVAITFNDPGGARLACRGKYILGNAGKSYGWPLGQGGTVTRWEEPMFIVVYH